MISKQPDPVNWPINTQHHLRRGKSDQDYRFPKPQHEANRYLQMIQPPGGIFYIPEGSYGWHQPVDFSQTVPMNYSDPPLTAIQSTLSTMPIQNNIVYHRAPMEHIQNQVGYHVTHTTTHGNLAAINSHQYIFQPHQVEYNQPVTCYGHLQYGSGFHYQTGDDTRSGTAPTFASKDHAGCSDIRNANITNHHATLCDIDINVNSNNPSGLASQNRSAINTVETCAITSLSQIGVSRTQEPSENTFRRIKEEGNNEHAPRPLESIGPNGQLYCLICKKAFTKICYLKQHNQSSHGKAKPYRCEKCGKRFPCETSLTEHQERHTGFKPNKCGVCPKEFVHKTDLTRHMSHHTGNKPHPCPTCGKVFIRRDQMRKHSVRHNKKAENNDVD